MLQFDPSVEESGLFKGRGFVPFALERGYDKKETDMKKLMFALIAGVDTVIAFFANSKIKWIELPIFIEIFAVMLYVVLGILIPTVWHPGWILCLLGPIAGLVEAIVFTAIRNDKKDKTEKKKAHDKYVKTDEKYWSDWD